MKYSMALLGTALLAATTLTATAQIQPVRISVTRSKQKALKTTARTDFSRTREGTETITYTVEVLNRSTKSYGKVTVKWGLLIKPRYREEQSQFVEGEHSEALPMGQKVTFDTDPVDLRVVKYENTYGTSSRQGAEISGYYVQVYDGEQLLGQESMPADTLEKIKALRNPNAKRHEF